ncbi:MAG TPA: type II toxin-antitoxin system RelE/ParE family toxin [Saprospiraceae bacterium]|nr:type II toxin-antitoxin system RelE/ParE family toxin [Saprospiraceae bacterium]
MARKKKEENDFIDLLLLLGGIWLLLKIFKTPSKAGIHGLPDAKRKLIPYIKKNSTNDFENDLKNYDRNEQGELIRLIIECRLSPELKMPRFRKFRDSIIYGELRIKQWRILVAKINEKDFIMISAFKKKTEETPKSEILKAEKRLKDYEGK